MDFLACAAFGPLKRILCVGLLIVAFHAIASAAGVVSITLNPDTVAGGAPSVATVTLDGPAVAGGIAVNLTSNNSAAAVPAIVFIAAGQPSGTVSIPTTPVKQQILATITASIGDSKQTASLTINPVGLASIVVNPTTLVEGAKADGVITLTGPAPAGGLKILISCDSKAASMPDSVTIPAGQTTAPFSIATKHIGGEVDMTIKATLGLVSADATLAIRPTGPASITLNPPNVKGGTESIGTVTLTGPAPKGGLTVNLSTNGKVLSFPPTLKIPEGALSATFPIKTILVSAPTPVTIMAKYGSAAPVTTLTVETAALAKLTLNPAAIMGGSQTDGIVTLSEPAKVSGITITLVSDQKTVTVPPSVTIPKGKASATFKVASTVGPAAVTANIKATLGAVTQSAALTVSLPTLNSFKLDPAVVDAEGITHGVITINGVAPAGGLVITLAASDKTVILPAKLSVDEGTNTVRFRIHTTKVTAQTTVTITATVGGTSLMTTLVIG